MSISRIEYDETDKCSSTNGNQSTESPETGSAPLLKLQSNGPLRGRDIPPWRFWLSRLVAALMLAAAAPLILVAYLLVRVTSKGPGFYRQTRLGLHGREFEVIKLRSMSINAESGTGPVWAKQNDPRVTYVGSWLRALHIDELPQLVNVIKGDMALVGPRPERPEIAAKLEESLPRFPQRLAVRPGITGLAQINLPANSDLESARKKLCLDLQYVKSSSLWFDIRIVTATAPRIVGCRGKLIRFINRICGVARDAKPPTADSRDIDDPQETPNNGWNTRPATAFGWATPSVNPTDVRATDDSNGACTNRRKLAYLTHLPITQWLFLKGQNHFMQQSGFEIHAMSSPGQRLDMLAERDNVTTHEIPIARSISPWRDFVSLIRIVRTLRRIRPDVLHLSTPKASLLGAIAARLTGVPVSVFLVRGFTSAQAEGSTRYFYQKLERLTAALATSTLCNAPSLLAYGRRNGILKPTQGSVLIHGMSNGVDLERFDRQNVESATLPPLTNDSESQSRRLVLGFVGRLADDKGIGILTESWKIIRDEFPTSTLLLVGPWETRDAVAPPDREYLESDSRVIVTGAVDDVRPYLKAMDLFVFPSFGEGFPNAPMEAAAFELPVISTKAVGCVDAVEHGVTGTLIPPRDAEALTDTIRAYLLDPRLREVHGSAGRARLESDFRRQPIWEALLTHYTQLLKRHRRARVATSVAPEGHVVNPEFEYSTVSSLGE